MARGRRGSVGYLARPWTFVRTYDGRNLRADVIAGLTVGVLLLPQGIAFAQIAGLPPEYGLNAAILGSIIGALWGSSRHLLTAPTNAVSLIVLSSLVPLATPNSLDFLLAAGLMTVLAGLLQLGLGLARLGVLANFVSHSVVVGFITGAALLIGLNQIEPLLGFDTPDQGHNVVAHLTAMASRLGDAHLATALLGLASVGLLLALRRYAPRVPAALLAIVGCGLVVALAELAPEGVAIIGALPRGLPPPVALPVLDLELIGKVSTGALAVAAIGLTQSVSIARATANESGQRLDANQELVGQGLANLACGFFSGYATAGSFSASAVNVRAGARTQMAPLVAGGFVLLAVLTLGPFAATIPKAALAAVLIVTALFMVDAREIRRIWSGPRGDRLVMLATFGGTLFLPIELAVVMGMLLSFGLYIARTSAPKVFSVLPDDTFTRLEPRSDRPECPQLAILDVHGDLYFGAVNQIEEVILDKLDQSPGLRFVLLRMHSVNQCDFSGIHCLEGVLQTVRERGGDIYMTRVHPSVMSVMERTGFCRLLGPENYLEETRAIEHLFYRVLDPAVCIYECPVRVWHECQGLPKRELALPPELRTVPVDEAVPVVGARVLWDALRSADAPRVIDVREPREFRRRHIIEAELLPLPRLFEDPPEPAERRLVLVCRSGRRSARAAQLLRHRGYLDVAILEGGMLAWEAAGLLDAADPTRPHEPLRPPLLVRD
jgi:sulfate permease, SulP family